MKTGKILRLTFSGLLASLVIIWFAFPGLVVTLAQQVELMRAGLQLQEVSVDGHSIQYADNGRQDAPVILAIHGFGGDLYNWPRMLVHLQEQYRVITLDLPGFGQSSRQADARYDVASQTERVRGFMDALQIPQAHLIGNSMGGWISTVLATRYPERVLSLALLNNGGIKTPRPSELTKSLQANGNVLLINTVADYDRLLDLVFVKQPFIPGPVRQFLTEQAIKNRAFNEQVFKDLGDYYIGMDTLLPQVPQPTLVVWGDQDKIIDVSAIDVMKPLLPGARYEIMSNVGHTPMIEVPEASARLYLDFLGSLTAE